MKVRELIRGEVVTIGEDEPLALALQLMAWNGIRHLPVVRDARVVGMLSDRDVLANVWPDRPTKTTGMVRDVMSSPVVTAPPHMDVEEAAAIMLRERIDALPVVQNGALLGILTSSDLLSHLAQCEVPPYPQEEPTVGTLMIRRVDAAFADDPLTEAAARMVARGIRHLPVVDGTMRVRGILSERDVRQATGRKLLEIEEGERAEYARRLRVGDVMTPEPRTIGEDEPLGNAVRALVEDRFGALPVVDEEDRLVGILSYVDLLRYLGYRLGEDTGRRASAMHA
ncbi:MAG TPA: CBS domain-containing protein [Sandaracinaceae bacterium]